MGVSLKKAADIVLNNSPGMKIIGGNVFGTFYTFDLVPEDYTYDKQNPPLIGAGRKAVRKKDGKIFYYDLFGDVEALNNSKKFGPDFTF